MHCRLHTYIQRVGELSRRSAEMFCEHVLSTWEAKIESVQKDDCVCGRRGMGLRSHRNFGLQMGEADTQSRTENI